MEEKVLKATLRDVIGKQVKALRRSGQLPAVIYGRSIEPITISLDARDTSRYLATVSSSHLITIEINGQPHTTMVREKQRHPVSGLLIHLDFQEVSMTERLRTDVQLVFFGESPAVKSLNAVLMENLEELEVEALPGNLPEVIRIDLSVLKNYGDVIRVKYIHLGEDVEILTDAEEIVAAVMTPAADEVTLPTTEAAEPEVIEKGKKEEEE